MTQAAQLAQYGANNVGLSFKNRIINGDMVIDQRNAGASVSLGSGSYTVDRWEGLENGSMAFTAQQSTTVPSGANFTNSILITTTTAASPGSTDRSQFEQYIEGYNIADFGWGTANASTVTLSFWVRSSLTGQFGGALANGAGNRSYPYSYTISAANTWEYKTITVPGDTSGTWNTTNGRALCVYFDLGMGSSLLGTAGAWAGSDFRGATGDVKLSETSGATFYLTGVQLEKGTVATSFDYLPYGTELQLCQRYYSRLSAAPSNGFVAFGSGAWYSTNAISLFMKYPTTMRTSPTLGYGGTLGPSYGSGGVSLITSVNSTYTGLDSALWQPGGLSGATVGDAGTLIAYGDTTAYVSFSAEL